MKTDKTKSVKELFDLTGRVAIITGGAGLLGRMHAEAIAEVGGFPVIADIEEGGAERVATEISSRFKIDSISIPTDITVLESVKELMERVLAHFGQVDILINNAAGNPKVEKSSGDKPEWSRFENFPLQIWNQDIAVGLTGAFICSQVIGTKMASCRSGVILNILSDLALIAPDQRIYQQPGVSEEEQPTKPVSYSVVKGALLNLTKYLAIYWAEKNVRINALSPGGVYNDQPDDFVQRLANLIPMGRMARVDEYKGAILFLVSDASSYMTGANLVVDGGRTAW